MKKILLVGLALCLILGISGCKEKDSDATTAPNATVPSTSAPLPSHSTPASSSTEPAGCVHEYTIDELSAPGCTIDGWVRYKCSKCGDILEEVVNAPGHEYIDGKCTYCSERDPSFQVDPNTCSHDYQIKIERMASCTEDGLLNYTCDKCDKHYQKVAPAYGHAYLDGSCTLCSAIMPECEHVYANATCEVAKICTLCGGADGDPLGHDYVDGICSRCGDEDPIYTPVSISFIVTVLAPDETPVKDITVTVFCSGSILPAGTGQTDEYGTAVITLRSSASYEVVLSNIPEGFTADSSYTFTTAEEVIILQAITE